MYCVILALKDNKENVRQMLFPNFDFFESETLENMPITEILLRILWASAGHTHEPKRLTVHFSESGREIGGKKACVPY